MKKEREEKDKEAVPMKEEGKLVMCPKCDKKNLLANKDGVYCSICGRIGGVDEIKKIFSDKREADEKAAPQRRRKVRTQGRGTEAVKFPQPQPRDYCHHRGQPPPS